MSGRPSIPAGRDNVAGNGCPSRRIRPVRILARAIPASFFALACAAFLASFLRTGKWTSLFWMVSEGIVVFLFVVRKDAVSVSRRPWDWISGLAGSFLILLVRPCDRALLPDAAGLALMLSGTAMEVFGKAALGRSFGIVAANRGVVAKGPYRIVRHPIYLGYLVVDLGFLLANWSLRNVAVTALTYAFQVSRIFSEERLLSEDGVYRRYRSQVRYRLIPGIF